jgi:hypothetical protein
MNSPCIIISSLVLLFAFEVPASLISVSVTGAANETKMGYTQGQNYTFTWFINDGYTGQDGRDVFNATENKWFSTSTTGPWIFSSVLGDGLIGTYAKAVADDMAPFEQLKVDSNGLLCWAATKTVSIPMGLFVDGAEAWNLVAYDLKIPELDYSNMSFVNPAAFLENYLGTYSSTGGGIYLDNGHAQDIEFTVSNVTIGVVPEPSTVLLFFIGGIGAWLLRRNKMKSREDAE